MSALKISDHALLRWLERAGGLDIEGLRLHLSATLERAHAAATTIGAVDYLITIDGLVHVVRAGTVSTILPEGSSQKKARDLGHGAAPR